MTMEQDTIVRTLSIPNQTSQLKAVREFVADVVHHSVIPPTFENGILLAVDEAVTNIIAHAYKEHRRDMIEITLDIDPRRFTVVIRDSGTSFDPKSIVNPSMKEHIVHGKRHGLGIFLMRQVMDEVEYLFKEGVRNELRMVKYLNRQK